MERQPNEPTQLEAGERDPYIERAIQEERDRQEAFEQGIERSGRNGLGFGIE